MWGKKTMEHSLQIKFSALFYLHSLVEIILSGTGEKSGTASGLYKAKTSNITNVNRGWQ